MNVLHNNKISVVWFVGMHAQYPTNQSPLSPPSARIQLLVTCLWMGVGVGPCVTLVMPSSNAFEWFSFSIVSGIFHSMWKQWRKWDGIPTFCKGQTWCSLYVGVFFCRWFVFLYQTTKTWRNWVNTDPALLGISIHAPESGISNITPWYSGYKCSI